MLDGYKIRDQAFTPLTHEYFRVVRDKKIK
jgi:hypothetical protein